MDDSHSAGLKHLRDKHLFQSVLAGQVLARTPHFVLHGLRGSTTDATVLQLGVLVPKRWARRAVTRNTIRRQIYAVGQAVPVGLSVGVVRLRRSFDTERYVSASSKVLKAAVRLELLGLFAQLD